MNLIFFDTETTSKDQGRLVQIAWAINDTDISCLSYIPAEPISIEAMEIHGITEEMVEKLPPFSISIEMFQQMFNENYPIAHNAKFDIGVMQREGVFFGQYIDTLRVSQHVLPDMPAHRLQYLRYALNLKPGENNTTAHDAAGDVAVLRQLYLYLEKKVDELYPAPYGVDQKTFTINKMLELTQIPIMMTVIPFGKYKGHRFDEIMESDKQDLRWLYQQPNLGDDLEATLKKYLD